MSNAEELMNNFMINKNKEILGENVENSEKHDDNFLSKTEKAKKAFSGENLVENDKTAYLLRKVINTTASVLILLGGFTSAFYILLKIGPLVVKFIRNILLGFFI